MRKELVKKSRFLSMVLRHKPEKINLDMDSCGWVCVNQLLKAAKLDIDTLKEIVETNEKKRFSFSEDGKKIRANQGHSISIDLGLKPATPPNTLFHGTARKSVDSIMESGLQKKGRQHVHLSRDKETAIKVGQRHGKPVVLVVDAEEMARNGHQFFVSDNGVWLTDKVPKEFINISWDQPMSCPVGHTIGKDFETRNDCFTGMCSFVMHQKCKEMKGIE